MALPTNEVTGARQEALTVSAPVRARVQSLQVTDEGSYAVADDLLSKIRHASKAVETRMDKILDPINESRREALKLKHELMDPLELLEQSVRGKMKDFRMEEQRQIRMKEDERRAETARLQSEIDEKQRKEDAAKSKILRERLAAQRQELEDAVIRTRTAAPSAPIEAANSGTRTIKRWRVTDIVALYSAAGDPNSIVPGDIFQVNDQAINRYFNEDSAAVSIWPGIEVYDDIQIVSRRR